MDPLPMAPSCALDESGLRSQLERYRRLGQGARVVEHTKRRLAILLVEHVDPAIVGETIAIERECCPFFMFDWEADPRRLAVSVSQPEHEPALDAIAFALGLEKAIQPEALD